jgi:hypothetical protein
MPSGRTQVPSFRGAITSLRRRPAHCRFRWFRCGAQSDRHANAWLRGDGDLRSPTASPPRRCLPL